MKKRIRVSIYSPQGPSGVKRDRKASKYPAKTGTLHDAFILEIENANKSTP